MFLSRLRLFRIPLTLLLLGLLGLSFVLVKNIVTVAWQKDQQEEALYLKSPNCFIHKDPSEVDQSLPPCQVTQAVVVAKPQNIVIDHRRSGDYPRTHRFFTLQYTNGYTQTVGDIDADMWNSTGIGSQASVTLWRNDIKEVDANGYHQSIINQKEWSRATSALAPWTVTSMILLLCLRLLWKLPDDNARMML